MDWESVFKDIQNFMDDSNQMMQQYPITTEYYWDWLMKSLGELGDKYNNHPLVNIFLTGILKYQDENYQKIVGGNLHG
ncbi:hypothetical protein ACYSNU_07420 [Enterococcus sp. LJL120]